MRFATAVLDMVYWLALACWFAALAAAGIAAMNAFGTLPAMEMTLEDFKAYATGEHGRITAGIVMEGVFFTVDVIQFAAAPIVVVALLAQLALGDSLQRWSNIVRTVCIVAAASLFAYHASSIAPTMNRHLQAYWNAARAGDLDRAASERAAFNELHPRAEAILRANLLLLVIAIGASAVAVRSKSPKSPQSPLETPRLVKHRS